MGTSTVAARVTGAPSDSRFYCTRSTKASEPYRRLGAAYLGFFAVMRSMERISTSAASRLSLCPYSTSARPSSSAFSSAGCRSLASFWMRAVFFFAAAFPRS